IVPVAKGMSAALKRDPEMRLQRAVGIWSAFDTEKLRCTSSYFPIIITSPLPSACVVRFVPKPCTTNGDSN
ncbi:hypothetical protein GGX14DRAFT_320700, partial [Mycena pura]